MKKILAFLIFISSAACAQTTSNQTPTLPDPLLTPGDTLPVTKSDVCLSGYSKSARNVSSSTKSKVFKRYNIDKTLHKTGEYEVDHLISLQLGGSNSINNLWPQFYAQDYGARTKDALEDRLHAKVCSGEISLEYAQKLISTDWIKAYDMYFPKK